MARRGRRLPPEGSLSFLDVICCGFGSIILLLMITKTVEPRIIEASTVNLEGKLAQLQEQLFEIRGETTILNRDLNAKQEQLSEYEERIAILRGQLASVKSRHDSLQVDTSTDAAIAGQLAMAKQQLTEEMKRLLGTQYQSKNQLIGGIPVDSEYIIFIIDTSGSMQYAWPRVVQEVENVLSIYPRVKGFQVMNGVGTYMFASYRGRWIKDSPKIRAQVMANLRNWNVFDPSNPEKGIVEAIRTFYEPGKRISIYVFGDDFMGGSTERLVRYVERINKVDAKGNRLVRIHGVGFPQTYLAAQQVTPSAIAFANLMRQLTWRNGGTFVGLNDYR
jgi:hypothetical protein